MNNSRTPNVFIEILTLFIVLLVSYIDVRKLYIFAFYQLTNFTGVISKPLYFPQPLLQKV